MFSGKASLLIMEASLLVLIALIVGVGCSSVGTTMPVSPGHELQPLVEGWQRFFTITWQQGDRHGTPILSGRVANKYGEAATDVQLLVEGLDAGGKVVTQKVAWLGDDVPPFDSTYFEVPVQAAPSYRVSVFAYDWLEGDPGRP